MRTAVCLFLYAAALPAMLSGACADDSRTGPPATVAMSAATTSPTSSPTSPPTSVLTPAPAPIGADVRPYTLPASTRNGELDRLITTLTSGEAAAVRAVMRETPSPCVVNPMDIQNPPACPTGVAAGTLLPVVGASAGEAIWPGDLARVLEIAASKDRLLFAVLRSGPREAGDWIPPSTYLIVLGDTGRTDTSVYFATGGEVVGAIFVPWMALAPLVDRYTIDGAILPFKARP